MALSVVYMVLPLASTPEAPADSVSEIYLFSLQDKEKSPLPANLGLGLWLTRSSAEVKASLPFRRSVTGLTSLHTCVGPVTLCRASENHHQLPLRCELYVAGALDLVFHL